MNMNEGQMKMQNDCDEIKKQLDTIDKTIKVLKDIKGMKPIIRENCKEDINRLMNWIYNQKVFNVLSVPIRYYLKFSQCINQSYVKIKIKC